MCVPTWAPAVCMCQSVVVGEVTPSFPTDDDTPLPSFFRLSACSFFLLLGLFVATLLLLLMILIIRLVTARQGGGLQELVVYVC